MPLPLRVQTDRAIELVLKEQTDADVLESGAGAEIIRFANSSGMQFPKNRIASRESRNDGKRRRGRDGSGHVEFAVNNDFIIGAYNTPIAAVLRNSFTASATLTDNEIGATIDQVDADGTVHFGVGATALTAGVRRGQVHYHTAGLSAADLNQNLVVIEATETTIKYHKALTAIASGANAAFSFTTRKNIIQGATDIAYTVEERRQTLAKSELARLVRFGGWTMGLAVDQNIDIGFSAMGAEKTTLTGGANFTNPTRAPGVGLVAPNAKLYIVGIGFLRLSAFNFNFDIQLSRESSVDPIPYDIIPGQPQISAQFTSIETDLDLEDDYLAETELDGFLFIEEPVSSGVKPCACIWMNSFTLSGPGKSGPGADRSSTRTYTIDPDLIESGGANEETNIMFSSSL